MTRNNSVLTDAQKRRFMLLLIGVMSGGMFVDGFVLGYTGALMPSITADLHLNTFWQGLIGASALMGVFFGAPIGGWFSDRIGRRPVFLVDLLIFVGCSIAQFFVADAVTLFVIRLLMGVAIGIEYAVGWPMLAEFAPARIRGKALVITEITWYGGYLASYTLGYLLIVNHTLSWNVILGLSTIPSVIVFILRWGIPESPRWLMSKGRKDEALAIANRFLPDEEVKDIAAHPYDPNKRKVRFWDLFNAKNIRGTIFVSSYFFGQAAPYFAIGFFVPTVLEKLGLEDGFVGGFFLNMIAFVGTIVVTMLVEKLSRRTMAILPFVMCTISLAAITMVESSAMILLCFLVFSLFIAWAGSIIAAFPGEVFPPDISGLATGFAAAVSRIGAAGGTFLMPSVIEKYGVSVAIWGAVAVCLFCAIVSYLWAPQTKGKKMSEIHH